MQPPLLGPWRVLLCGEPGSGQQELCDALAFKIYPPVERHLYDLFGLLKELPAEIKDFSVDKALMHYVVKACR